MGRIRFHSARERRLWLLAAGLLLAIYASAYFVQQLLDPLRARGLLGATVWGVLLVGVSAALAAVVRARPGPWEVALLVVAAGGFLLLLRRLDIVQERLHLLEYGLLGGLVYGALSARWAAAPRRCRAAAWAIVIASAGGWTDELVQGLLPNRVYDLRDVATNAEAAALLVVVLAARARLRAGRAGRTTGAAPRPPSSPAIE